MKNSIKIGIFIFLLILLAVLGGILIGSADTNQLDIANNNSDISTGFNWYDNLDSAIFDAKKFNKPIFVFFYANWCPACKQLESDALGNNNIKQKLSQNYVAVKINGDYNPELSSKYRIYSIPTLIFMNSNGEEYKRIEGYRSPDVLFNEL
jgi:thiol:disulfide interchange protein DsbD